MNPVSLCAKPDSCEVYAAVTTTWSPTEKVPVVILQSNFPFAATPVFGLQIATTVPMVTFMELIVVPAAFPKLMVDAAVPVPAVVV